MRSLPRAYSPAAAAKRAWSQARDKKSREDFAGGKGTGGTPLFDFLKPLKEDSRDALL